MHCTPLHCAALRCTTPLRYYTTAPQHHYTTTLLHGYTTTPPYYYTTTRHDTTVRTVQSARYETVQSSTVQCPSLFVEEERARLLICLTGDQCNTGLLTDSNKLACHTLRLCDQMRSMDGQRSQSHVFGRLRPEANENPNQPDGNLSLVPDDWAPTGLL